MSLNPNSANVLVFSERSKDWTQQELAEFYRVESALTQAGLNVSSDRGLSDEGDPWFVFFRDSDHEPLVHFARVDGYYIIASAAYDGIARGKNFREMIIDLLSRHRLNTEVVTKKSNVFFHPAALLITLVGVAFFKAASTAKADEISSSDPAPHKNGGIVLSKEKTPVTLSSATFNTPIMPPPQYSGSYEEVASLLLPLVAEITLDDISASAREASVSQTKYDHTSSTSYEHSSQTLVKSIDAPQRFLSQADTNFNSPSTLKADYVIDGNKAEVSFIISDAKSLLDLLSAIPHSTEPNHFESLSAYSKSEHIISHTSHQPPVIGNSHYAPILFSTRFTPAELKSTGLTTSVMEKEQKNITSEITQTSGEKNHISETHNSIFPIHNTETPIQAPVTEYKVDISAAAPSAIAIISQLGRYIQFSDWDGGSPLKIGDEFNARTQNPSEKFGGFESEKTFITTVQNYSISVFETPSQSLPKTTFADGNSINLSGDEVNNFLMKFLQTFSNTSFEVKADDEFIFRTESSKISGGPIEEITIHFQDGSNIEIIGQKTEIDGFMLSS